MTALLGAERGTLFTVMITGEAHVEPVFGKTSNRGREDSQGFELPFRALTVTALLGFESLPYIVSALGIKGRFQELTLYSLN